jgi:hypothetical protein
MLSYFWLMKKWIFSLFFIITMLNANAHKFYVSISQINYNPTTNSVEISLKLFTDDLENCVQSKTGKVIKINNEGTNDEDIAHYLNQLFSIKINGKEHPINYLGKEIEYDVTWCYLEIKDIASISEISIRNEIFTHLLPDQKNLVQLKVGTLEESTILRKGNPIITYQIP